MTSGETNQDVPESVALSPESKGMGWYAGVTSVRLSRALTHQPVLRLIYLVMSTLVKDEFIIDISPSKPLQRAFPHQLLRSQRALSRGISMYSRSNPANLSYSS
jgi:hypothetical protein